MADVDRRSASGRGSALGDRQVGFIGLGAMGQPMASRLLEKERKLAVYDPRDEAMRTLADRGATPCARASAAQVADRARAVFLSFPTPQTVASVATGPDGLVEGKAIEACVDLATTGPVVATQVASHLAKSGIEYLDAPLSGGPARAETGELAIMAAGPRALFERLLPLLETLGSSLFHVGDTPEQGQLTKVINNLLSATAFAATAEALVLGTRGGLDPERLLAVINASSGRNTATADKFPRCVLPRTFDYGFRLALMVKDVDLCLEEGDRARVPMLLGSTVQQLWRLASIQARDGADMTEFVKMVEDWAGVTVRAGLAGGGEGGR